MKTSKLMLAGTLAASLLFTFSTAQAAFIAEWPDIFGIDFRINNPGARANGMGGAFIGLADDATAAYTNPAGLTVLTRPEVSVEYKYGEYTNVVNDIGVDYNTKTLTPQDVEYTDSAQGPSFLSYVKPLSTGTIAIYRHQLMNLKTNFNYLSNTPSSFNSDLEIEANTTGFGLGLKVTDSLSFGVSAGFTDMQYKEHSRGHQGPLDQAYEEVDGQDQDIHYTASLLWQPSDKIGLGLVYRQGPEFSFRKRGYILSQVLSDYNGDMVIDFSDLDTNGDGIFDSSDQPIYDTVSLERFNVEHSIKMPDIYAIGLSYRIIPNLTISADANYIEYSDLITDIRGVTSVDALNEYTIDDTIEFHLGLEYIIEMNSAPLALRCGYFFKPEHRFHYTGSDPFTSQIQHEGDDDHIFSLGVGTLLTDNVQIDLSGSYGDFVTEGTASLVYRFE